MTKRASKNGWTRVAFGDVVRQVRDRVDPEESGLERYVAGEHMDSDDLRIRRWGLIGDGYLGPAFHMRFKPGQVLYGSRRTYLRKVAVADFEGITANTTFVIESKDPKVLLPELLPFLMQTESFHEHSIKQSKGSVNPYINFSDLTWYEFALPPLEEQQRISRLLLATEVARQRARAAAETLEKTLGSWLRVRLGQIGVTKPLGDVLLSTDYGCSTHATEDQDGIPILRIPNVLRGELDLSDMKWVRLSAAEVEKYTLRRNDILIVRTNGNPDYVGRCLVVPALPEVTVFASYLIRLVVDPSQILAAYVATVLNSSGVRHLLRSAVRSSAGNYNINTNGIRSVQVPLPSLPEQEAILTDLAGFSEMETRFQDRRCQIDALHKAVMINLQP